MLESCTSMSVVSHGCKMTFLITHDPWIFWALCSGKRMQNWPDSQSNVSSPFRSVLSVAARHTKNHLKKSKVISTQKRPSLTKTLSNTYASFTDTCDLIWAIVVTQCDPFELNKSVPGQKKDHLAFPYGSFFNTITWWTTFEKDSSAIFKLFVHFYYMLLCEVLICIFTDHQNLHFVFCPTLLDPSLGRHKVMKDQKWAVFLSQLHYQIYHVR